MGLPRNKQDCVMFLEQEKLVHENSGDGKDREAEVLHLPWACSAATRQGWQEKTMHCDTTCLWYENQWATKMLLYFPMARHLIRKASYPDMTKTRLRSIIYQKWVLRAFLKRKEVRRSRVTAESKNGRHEMILMKALLDSPPRCSPQILRNIRGDVMNSRRSIAKWVFT